MTARKNQSLGKNRETPPPRPYRRHRGLIRQAVAQRLVAGYWSVHGENLRGSSVAGCGRWKKFSAVQGIATIQITDGVPRMDGHFVCGCNWTCETCATATVAQNRSWIRAAMLPALEAQGKTCSLVTLTLAHSYGDDWGHVVRSVVEAYKLMDRRVHKAYKKAGSIGKFKALEAPIGAHGIHPHIHVLVTHDIGADLDALAEAMRIQWNRAVVEVGGRCNEFGFDFKQNAASTYVAKMEVAHELAAQSTKNGRRKGRTLSQLLDAAGRGDLTAGAEWQRAIAALGGAYRFHAGSLPKNLGIVPPSEWEDLAEDVEDVEDAGGEPVPEPVVVRIEYPLDDHIAATHPALGRPGLAMILRAAARGGRPAVLNIVRALKTEYRQCDAYRALSVGEPWSAEPIPDIMAIAAARPLQPHEVAEYLRVKKSLLAARLVCELEFR
jgi:hypothetical protein